MELLLEHILKVLGQHNLSKVVANHMLVTTLMIVMMRQKTSTRQTGTIPRCTRAR